MAFGTRMIDKETPIPMYFQLKNIILNEMKSGNLAQGDVLPTELEFGQMFNLSRTTIRQAIVELVSEGYLYRVKGKGTFVAKPKLVQDFMRKIESYNEQMARLNLTPKTKVILNRRIKASKEIAENLNVRKGDEVVHLKRLRYANDEPIVVLDTYLIIECKNILNMDMEKKGLYDYLSLHQKTKISRVVRQFEAVGASKEQSNYLQIKTGHPVQLVTTVGFNADGKPVEFSIANYRGDKNKFVVELHS